MLRYICVCIYKCVCVFVYVCVSRAKMYVCVYVYIRIHACLFMLLNKYIVSELYLDGNNLDSVGAAEILNQYIEVTEHNNTLITVSGFILSGYIAELYNHIII